MEKTGIVLGNGPMGYILSTILYYDGGERFCVVDEC